jgi:hypothetical protein
MSFARTRTGRCISSIILTALLFTSIAGLWGGTATQVSAKAAAPDPPAVPIANGFQDSGMFAAVGSVITGVLSFGVGYFATKLLDHLLGGDASKGPDCQAISDKLDKVGQGIIDMRRDMERMVAALHIELKDIERAVKENPALTAITHIETDYETLLERFGGKIPGQVPSDDIKDWILAHENFTENSNTYQINLIRNSLLSEPNRKGMLELFVDQSIMKTAQNAGSGDFSAKIESRNGVGIIAERPIYSDYEGIQSGTDDGGPTTPSKVFYLAEGTCRPGFKTFICMENPGDVAANVKLTYMKGDGTTFVQKMLLGKSSRQTVNVKDLLGEGDDPAHDFSTKIESSAPIVTERPMYFDFEGWQGGHDAGGTDAPSKTFYFAEGTARPGFRPYICLQNPGDVAADVKLAYMKGDGTTVEQFVGVGAHSRQTVNPKDMLGEGDDPAHDFSTKVMSSAPIVAERPVYFNSGGYDGGHNEMGAVAPSRTFYFAEGTARPGFRPYICLQNPGKDAANVKITYMRGDGTYEDAFIGLSPESRQTIDPKDVLGEGDDVAHDFSAKVVSSAPIVAERPMYFNYQGVCNDGHVAMGATGTCTSTFFAEGSRRPGFQTYFCIQNPNDSAANVRVTLMDESGVKKNTDLTVKPHSRSTMSVDAGDSGIGLVEQYIAFEQYFMKWLSMQFQAAGMEVMYRQAAARMGKNFGTIEDYINKIFNPKILEELNQFEKEAQRLVMSATKPKNDEIDQNTSGQLLDDNGKYVLARAGFMRRQFSGAPSKDYGLAVTYSVNKDIVEGPEGVPNPPLLAVERGTDRRLYPNPAKTRVTTVPWQTVDGDIVPYYSTIWNLGQGGITLTRDSSLTTVMCWFDDVKPGLEYDIMDWRGCNIAVGKVYNFTEGFGYIPPTSPQTGINYGSAAAVLHKTDMIVKDPSLWYQYTSRAVPEGNNVYPSPPDLKKDIKSKMMSRSVSSWPDVNHVWETVKWGYTDDTFTQFIYTGADTKAYVRLEGNLDMTLEIGSMTPGTVSGKVRFYLYDMTANAITATSDDWYNELHQVAWDSSTQYPTKRVDVPSKDTLPREVALKGGHNYRLGFAIESAGWWWLDGRVARTYVKAAINHYYLYFSK